MPPEMILFGEEAWLVALRAARLIGRDCGAAVADCVRGADRQLGNEPLVPGTLFGMRLFACERDL